MKISRKLSISFAVMITLIIIISATGISNMRKLRLSSFFIYEKQVLGIECLGKMASIFKQIRLDGQQIIINCFYDDKKGASDIRKQFENHVDAFKEQMKLCKELAVTDELLKFHERIMYLFEYMYLPTSRKIIEHSLNDIPDHNNRLYINVLLASVIDPTNRIENFITGMTRLNAALAEQADVDNFLIMKRFIVQQALLLVSAVLLAISLTLYFMRSIAAPINEAANALHRIASGDFDARVTGDYSGEFSVIKNSVNTTAVGIKTYMHSIVQAEKESHELELAKATAEAATEALISSITYAGKIQRNLLRKEAIFQKAFSDYSIIWNPMDIVGGDIYWIKIFQEGAVLCVCDCTGHGTSGAFLTMLVISAFESLINQSNYNDPAQIIRELDQQLDATFHINSYTNHIDIEENVKSIGNTRDGCDLAVLFISKDGSVKISSGNMHVFICNGTEVQQIKGQKIFIGEGKIINKNSVKTILIPADSRNKFYIASDGLYDQVGGDSVIPFGYNRFKQIILEKHMEKQIAISDAIWNAFEIYRGQQPRRDDVQLITFQTYYKY